MSRVDNPQPRLLDRIPERLRWKHYSIRNEQAYVDGIKRFILFHGERHPGAMGKAEVERFFTHLAVERNVAASTPNQALSAIMFVYKEVLGRELEWLYNVERTKRPARAGGLDRSRAAGGSAGEPSCRPQEDTGRQGHRL
jgi:hypothetical protein